MHYSIRMFAAAVFGAAVFIPAAKAQDLVTQTFGGTTIWVGGGVQFLTLPDIKFTGVTNNPMAPTTINRQKNSDFAEYGWATGGGIETALGFWGNHRVTGAIKGFFANMDDDSNTNCWVNCIVADPTGETGLSTNGSLFTTTERDVDYWGGQVEFKFARAEPVHVRPNLYRNDFFLAGADIRGIDQDNKLRGRFGDAVFDFPGTANSPAYSYRETLDTTYYGGYVGFGGEYTIPIIGGIGDGWGLRTFISGRAGLYAAETDFDGRFALEGPWGEFLQTGIPEPIPGKTRLVKSNSELAFIGSLSFETRKPIGPRASLSLWTDYEYISSVPEMHYTDVSGRPTRIGESDAFASRTMLRLNIGLGSAQLYPVAPAYK